jgi:uncharacterized protein DUF6719
VLATTFIQALDDRGRRRYAGLAHFGAYRHWIEACTITKVVTEPLGRWEGNMRTIIGLATLALCLASNGICNAQTIVKQEPIYLLQGTSVLVDDGTCGAGKIKQVIAGNWNPMFGNENRVRKCIPK